MKPKKKKTVTPLLGADFALNTPTGNVTNDNHAVSPFVELQCFSIWSCHNKRYCLALVWKMAVASVIQGAFQIAYQRLPAILSKNLKRVMYNPSVPSNQTSRKEKFAMQTKQTWEISLCLLYKIVHDLSLNVILTSNIPEFSWHTETSRDVKKAPYTKICQNFHYKSPTSG